jgi:hypothetical protein
MFCFNCANELNNDADFCHTCGKQVKSTSVRKKNYKYCRNAPKTLNGWALRNQRNREVLPHDDRMRKIISDFEFRSDVVFKPAQTLRVYPAHRTYNIPESSLSVGIMSLNIALALVLPPIGLIQGFALIARNGGRDRNLGLIMLIVSACLLLVWAFVIVNVMFDLTWTLPQGPTAGLAWKPNASNLYALFRMFY